MASSPLVEITLLHRAMRLELEEKTSMGAADQERLAEMEDRKKAIDVFRVRATRHVNEYRRELIRLETELKKVLPMVREGNQMARVLGRSETGAAEART